MANAKVSTKEAVAEINKLIESFNLLIKATGDVSTITAGNFRKVETALAGLKTISDQSTNSFNKMNAAQQQAVLINQKEAAALKKSAEETVKLANANASAAATQDKLNDATKRGAFSTQGLITNIKALISAFGIVNGIQIFANLIKNAFELTKEFNSMSFALKTLEQDTMKVAESQ